MGLRPVPIEHSIKNKERLKILKVLAALDYKNVVMYECGRNDIAIILQRGNDYIPLCSKCAENYSGLLKIVMDFREKHDK